MNRLAVLSNVNGNLEALEAVLEDIDKEKVDRIIFLGDAIGCGPDSITCLNILRDRASIYLRGRYECLITSGEGYSLSTPSESQFIETLDQEIRGGHKALGEWLSDQTFHHMEQGFSADSIHPKGPPRKGVMPEMVQVGGIYSFSTLFSEKHFLHFLGNNHQPWVLFEDGKALWDKETDYRHLRKANERVVVSVGSVGQPRDGDWRACYVVATDEAILWKRLPYDIDKTIGKVNRMPVAAPFYAERLRLGI